VGPKVLMKPPRSPTRFAPADIPRFECRPVARERERRGSASERGYDHEWSKLSASHRRKEPLCRTCLFRGFRRAAELVNHVVPVRDAPERRLDPTNLSSHCQRCHDTIIRDLERLAREAGDITLMEAWVKSPSLWPEPMSFEAILKPRILR
jgi:5-methylcytosine-specific restriction protein A